MIGDASTSRVFVRRLRQLGSVGALTFAILASVGLALFLNHQTPIREWLAVQLAPLVAWQLILNFAWLCAGVAIVRRMIPTRLPMLEMLSISVATGVVAFYLAFYALGAMRLFRPAAAVGLALLFIAAGLRPLLSWWREQRRADGAAEGNGGPRMGPLALAATAFGVLGVAAVYLGAFTPSAINYDASMYHIPVAEAYAREGRIFGFDGSWHREYPHLTGIINTWGFLVPGLPNPALRWMMLLHTEFAFFCWMLVGVAAAVNWMVKRPPVRGAWAAFFLFPGIFIYDGNLGGGADHVLAFFAIPLFLLSVRAPLWTSNAPYVLWGAVAGGAMMTKYLGVYAVGPLGLLLLVSVVRRRQDVRPLGLGLVRPAAWLLAGFVLVAAPHAIKNVVCHGSPVYPMLQDWFTASHPTVRDATIFVENIVADRWARAPSEPGRRVWESLQLLFSFPFKPHYSFMGDLPTFGFAFTLALPFVLVVPDRKRLLAGIAVSMGALFIWASTYRVDRHIQDFFPLMAATTAALLVAAWRLGRAARVGVAVLVAVQLVWAGDLFTVGLERANTAVSLIHSARDKRAASRFDGFFADHQGVERALPPNAVLLLHHWHPQIGFNRRIYLDWAGFQGLIDYRNFATPRDLFDRVRALGVTHVVHLPNAFTSPYMMEMVIFDAFAFTSPGPKSRFGQFELFPMPATPPTPRPPLQVSTLGLSGYVDGLYPIGALDNCATLPGEFQHFNAPKVRPGEKGMLPLLAESDAVLRSSSATPDAATADVLAREFQAVSNYPGLTVLLRTVAAPGRVPFVSGVP